MIILLFTNNNINLLTGIFKCKYKNKIFFRCYNYILLFLKIKYFLDVIIIYYYFYCKLNLIIYLLIFLFIYLFK